MQWVKRVFGGTASRLDGKPAVQSSLIMALEPRMMFDGAVAATTAAATDAAKTTDTQDAASADKSAAAASASKDTSSASHAAATDSGPAAGSASGRNVVFVDSRVADAQQLLQGVAANTDVVFLERNGNGVQQMAQYLAAHPGAASVQIIAHGYDGDLWLGNSYVSAENIADYGKALTQLGSNMQAGGDILIYACNTAQGERGQTFVDELASLTGRDIAASNDRTGNGSDWDLEVTTGSIEARPVLSATSTSAYSHDLAMITVTNGADYGPGSLRNALATASTSSVDTIAFSSGMTVTLSSGQLVIDRSLNIEGDVDGNGTADVTIDANYTSRVMMVSSGTVKLDGLIFEHGLVSGNGGDYNSVNGKDALGAGIAILGGNVTITHSSITANVAAAGGGNGGGSGYSYGYGGGGGAGFQGKGGARGGAYSPINPGASGGNGIGGTGGAAMGGYTAQAGKGGSTMGGAGGSYVGGLSSGGAGARAGSAATGYIGGGGAGSGASGAVAVGKGGSAAGAMYVGVGATVYIANTSITNNLGAGGGGAGSSYSMNAANGGDGVGGILCRGTLVYQSSTVTWSNNYGSGGQGGGNQNGMAWGSVGSGSNTGSENLQPQSGGVINPNWNPNVAPVVGNLNGDSVSFTEKGSAVLLDSGGNATVSDSDSANFSGGNVTVAIVTNAVAAQDVLSIGNQGTGAGQIGVSGSNVTYSGTTIGTFSGGSSGINLVVSLNSSATPTAVQALLRDLYYSNSNTSDPSGATRTVRVTVNDGDGGTSSNADVSVAVVTVNDAPILNASGAAPTFTENGSAVDLFSGVAISPVESAQSIKALTLSVSNVSDGSSEILTIDGSAISLTNGNSLTTLNNGMDVTVSLSGGTATVTVIKATGMSLVAAYSLVDGISYRNSSENPSSGNRVVTLTSVQDNGGTSNGGSDTTMLAVAATVNVVAVNDPPLLTTSGGSAAFVAGDNSSGTPVAIDSGLTLSDPDNTSLASARVSISGNLHSGEDILAFTNDNATAYGNIAASYDTATGVLTLTSSGASASLAQWQAALRAVTYTDSAVTPNSATRTISFVANDGSADSNVATRSLSVTAVDQTPILTTSAGSTAFVEGNNSPSTPVVIDSGLTLSDLDNVTLASASVTVAGNFRSGEDLLAFSNGSATTYGNIVASYNTATGVLTMTSAGATATLAQWQAALRAVTYSNTSETPNGATRTLAFTVSDGTKSSAAGTRSVTVTAVDDTPLLSTSGGTSAFTEGNNVASTPVTIDSGLTLSDLDNATLASASVSISGNLQSAEDVLGFTNNPATMGNIAASYDSASGVLTLTSAGASATLAQWQAALRSVTYGNLSETPNTATRTIAFVINDGSVDSAIATKSVTVTAVDDSPVLTTSAGTTSFTEGANVASTPVAIDSGLTLSDLDNATLASASVTISGNFQSGQDLLAFSNDGSSMGDISGSYNAATGVLTLTSSGASATLAQWQAALRSVTYDNSSESPNSSSRTLSFVVNDGSSDSNVGNKTLSVTSVNDAPVNTLPGAQSLLRDTSLTFSSGNGNALSVSDADAGSGAMQVTLTVSHGRITLSGTTGLSFLVGSGSGDSTMTFSGSLSDINNALNGLVYTPSAGYSGADSLQLTSNDQGNTGSGGAKSDTDSIALSIDIPNPVVQNVSSSSADGTYKVGDTLYLTVSFDQAVTVDSSGGTPTLLLETGAIDRNASYVSGSGSSTLTFAYTVQAGDLSADLDFASSSALALNGATIRNAGGDAAVLTLPTAGTANSIGAQKNLVIDGVAPSVASVGVPANGTYVAGQNLDFTLNYSEAVVVDTSGGTPYITVTLDTGGTVDALYVSGSGTSALTFRTVVGSGQQDTNGIALGASVQLNGGSVRDVAGNDALTTLNSVGSTSNVLVDGIAPSVSGIARVEASPNNASSLHYSVTFSEAVSGLDISDFTLVGTGTASGVLSSISQIDSRTYSVLVTAVSGDGSLRLDLNGSGTGITDLAGNALPAGLQGEAYTLDHSSPQVTSVSVPADGGYKAGERLNFTVNASEAVLVDTTGGTPRLALTIGTSTVYADYVSGSGTSALVFQYRVQTGDNDADGIAVGALSANGGTLRDAAGNDALLTLNAVGATSQVLVDTRVPTVTSVAVPSTGSYNAGDVLTFTVNASEALQIDRSAGTPRLALDIGGTTAYANYVSGSGSATLVFQYQVRAGDTDNDGIQVLGLQANGGTLRDGAGNDAVLTLNGVGSTAAVLIDTTAPSVVGVEVPANGAYNAGDLLNFTLNTSEAVLVDTSGGTPRLALDIGGRTVYADYLSGSGGSALLFQYRVQAGDNDANGIGILALQANGATLRDAAGNDAALTLNSVRDSRQVLVDTTAPDATAISRVEASPSGASSLHFDVTFTEAVDGLSLSSFALQSSGTASGQLVAVTRLNDLTWRVSVGNLSGDGTLSLALRADNGIHDQAGNSLQQGLQGPAYVLDHSGPAVSAVQLPADGRYTAGQTLQFGVDFNDAVNVDTSGGVPRIAITLQQGGTVYATYVSGSGSNQLLFAYTVGAGQADSDGIQLADVIQSNGGRLTDALGNAADLNLGSLPATSGLLVQGSGNNGDPQLRGDDGRFTAALPFGNGNPGNGPALPSPVQYAGPPALGQPPLLDTSNQGAAQSAFSSLFRNTPTQSQFALIFANNGSNSSWGDGSGVGFLGFGGGDAGVYGESTLSSVFSAALEHEDQALSAFDHRGAGKGGLSGVFSAPGLGQQLHEMNQREQRQVADLARAFGELGREGPAS